MLAWSHLAHKDTEFAANRFRELYAKFPQTAHAREAAYWLAVAAADEQNRVTALGYVEWLIQELSPGGKAYKRSAGATLATGPVLEVPVGWQRWPVAVNQRLDRCQ